MSQQQNRLRRFGRLAGAAVAIVVAVLASDAALAADAYTTGNLNVRTGPDTSYARVTTLAAHTPVMVRTCRSGWCAIRSGRVSGWVSSSYLSFSGGAPPAYVGPSVVPVPVPVWVDPWYRPHRWRPYPWHRWPPRHRHPYLGPGPVRSPWFNPPHWPGARR